MIFLDLDENALSRAKALHTAREIAQQPRSWLRTESLLRGLSGRIEDFVRPLTAGADSRIILTGAGSSSFIGETLAPLLLRHLDRRVEAIATTDLLAAPYLYLQQNVPTLLVSFSRSGNSPESAAVMDLASRLVPKCRQLVLTCNEHGTLYQRFRDRDDSLVILLPPETHDQGFAMTSSFTSMLLAACLIFRQGAEVVPVATIARAGELLLSQHNTALRELAARKFSRVVYLGSGCFKGLAREAALKLLEMTDGQIVASSDSALGFRHGPKAVVNNDTLVFVFVSNDSYTRRYDLDLLRELRSEGRAGLVVAVTAQASDAADAAIGGEFLSISGLEAAQDASVLLPYIVCAQLYAFHRSLALGNSPDEPIRSGTVNRVVRGVTVHSL